MGSDLDRLLDVLDLEPIDRDLFRGPNPDDGPRRVFGGKVAGQALRAATLTVDAEHRVHSLHGYFLRPGQPGRPIIYHVDRIRDGRSFITRRVVARQQGEAIFNLEASFHVAEHGPEHQGPAPTDLHDPEGLPRRAFGGPHHHSIDTRELEPIPPSTRRVWLRAAGRLPDDPGLHACVLAYASDMGPVGAAARPVLRADPMMRASLDHTMWFHRPTRADEWLLYDLESVSVSGGRGLARGTMFDRSGRLVVSVVQEALLRPVGR
jgi:acyl-CoA thioesterase-2